MSNISRFRQQLIQTIGSRPVFTACQEVGAPGQRQRRILPFLAALWHNEQGMPVSCDSRQNSLHAKPRAATTRPADVLSAESAGSFTLQLSDHLPDNALWGCCNIEKDSASRQTLSQRPRNPVEAHQKQEVVGRTNRLLSFDTNEPHRNRRLQQFFVLAETSLPSCYLATIRGHTDL
jgi:hypothetical protein